MRYIAFDVETPNHYNNRMSSIGIAIIEGDQIIDTYSSYVNPETFFMQFNIDLTHLSSAVVRHAPTFKELWPTISPIMNSGVLVAHNASFDLKVLSYCLNAYHIPHRPYYSYIDTVTLARHVHPDLMNHKLNTVASSLELDLNHHQAASDSIVCGEILIDALHHGIDLNTFTREYNIDARKTKK